jgi:type IV secretory pathway TrbL component
MFSTIDRAYMTVQNLLNAGFPLLSHMVWAWFGLMCAWAVFLGVIEWLSGQSPVGMISGAFVRLGVFVYLAGSWKIIIDGLGNMALQIGLKISGATASADEIMSPGGIFGVGNTEANRVIDAKNAMCDGWRACLNTFGDQFLLEVLVIGIWICFAILALSLIMAALTFKMHGLFAFIFLPFSQLKATSFLTESAISGVIQGAVWLTFVAMVAGFASIVLTFMKLPASPDVADILPAFLVYLFVGVMGWQSRTFAQGIVTGTTRLGGEALTAAARNTLGWATGTAALGKSIAMASERPVVGIANAAGATVHAGRVATAKLTGRPMPAPRQPFGASSGSSSGSQRRGSAWNQPPTEKQAAAAKARGVDISGMNRGKASEVLEKQGKMDPSWYKE